MKTLFVIIALFFSTLSFCQYRLDENYKKMIEENIGQNMVDYINKLVLEKKYDLLKDIKDKSTSQILIEETLDNIENANREVIIILTQIKVAMNYPELPAAQQRIVELLAKEKLNYELMYFYDIQLGQIYEHSSTFLAKK